MLPKISLIVGCYNMARELPRTVRSLSPVMQRQVEGLPYEIIVVDNGSPDPFDDATCRDWSEGLRVLRFPQGTPSPVGALNSAVSEARGELIGVLIDGARIASPGLVATAAIADSIADRAFVATLGFHLGPDVQSRSIKRGYDQTVEDELLKRSGWTEDGYRLFDISVLAHSSRGGWFRPIAESNAFFMRRSLWEELGGFDEKFQSPGGGLVNLDLFARAVNLADVTVVTLLGEGTFHQVHGGIATNADENRFAVFAEEYRAIRGHDYRPPEYDSLYLGTMPEAALKSIEPSGSV